MATNSNGGKGRANGSGRKLGYAVVGLGHIAQAAVLPAFANAAENSRLVALVSGDPEKQRAMARQYGVEKVFSYEEYDACLADPEVDAVYIALPNTMHVEFAERAARAGVHVLCEKPMALSTEDCGRMIQACDDAGVKLMIAYRLHFDEANLRAIEAVQGGEIGEPRLFTSAFAFQVAENNIRTDPDRGGGVLWDIGIYCVNAARYLFRAEPVEVYAQRALSADPRFRETEESVSAMLRFPEDRLATFVASFGSPAVATYTVLGTGGRLQLDNAYEYQGSLELTVTRPGKEPKKHTVPAHDQFAPELVYFSRCVLEDERPEPDGWEGLADIRIIEALYESADTGRPIMLEPVTKRLRPGRDMQIRKPAPKEEPPLVNVEDPAQA